MLIGILLALSWLILLVLYPRRALPISLIALIALGLVASWVLWQDHREKRNLAYLETRITYAPDQCSADRPLAMTLKNGSKAALVELRWEVAAYRPGETVNLARPMYDTPHYRGPSGLLPGETWTSCLPLPNLRSGYRANTLEFRAEHLRGQFIR